LLLLLVRVAACRRLVLRLVAILLRVIATLLRSLRAVAILRRLGRLRTRSVPILWLLSGLRAGAVTILWLSISPLLPIVALGRGRSVGLAWLLRLGLRLRV
jgi:hypothetical protein